MAMLDSPLDKASRFLVIGNDLAIDFANTVYDPHGRSDGLESWNDLVDFLVATKAIDAIMADGLRSRARQTPAACAAALAEAVALRATLRQILPALADGEPIRPAWVSLINQALKSDEGCAQLVEEDGRLKLVFTPSHDRPACVLGPIAHATARLLVVGAKLRIRKCANPNCILYFRDTSRTGVRRWCSMASCGNRHKVNAFLARTRRKSAVRRAAHRAQGARHVTLVRG
jgi:predicted RNA-binding Zn ribbon-like protein